MLHGCGLTDSREISIDERQESDFVIKERRLEMVCASLVDGQWWTAETSRVLGAEGCGDKTELHRQHYSVLADF